MSYASRPAIDGDQRQPSWRECRLAFCREEMGKLVVLIKHAEMVADLHIDIALGKRLLGNPAAVLWDGIGAEQRFVHTHS
jgi:hypothetical protein